MTRYQADRLWTAITSSQHFLGMASMLSQELTKLQDSDDGRKIYSMPHVRKIAAAFLREWADALETGTATDRIEKDAR